MEVVTDMTLKTYGRGQPDHCVVFRKGGTENFTWHRSLAMTTKVAAVTTAATCRKMGYAAYVTNYAQSLSASACRKATTERQTTVHVVIHPRLTYIRLCSLKARCSHAQTRSMR